MGKRKNKAKKASVDAVVEPSKRGASESTPVTSETPQRHHSHSSSEPLPKETPRKGLEMKDMRPVARSLDICCSDNHCSSDNNLSQEADKAPEATSEHPSAGDETDGLTAVMNVVQEVEKELSPQQYDCEGSSRITSSYIFNGPVGRSVRHVFHFLLTGVIRIWAIFARFVFWYLLIDLSPPNSDSLPETNKTSFPRRALSLFLVLFFWPFYLFMAAFRVSSKVVMAALLTIAAPHPETSSRKEADTSPAIGAPATSASYCNEDEGESSRAVASSHLL